DSCDGEKQRYPSRPTTAMAAPRAGLLPASSLLPRLTYFRVRSARSWLGVPPSPFAGGARSHRARLVEAEARLSQLPVDLNGMEAVALLAKHGGAGAQHLVLRPPSFGGLEHQLRLEGGEGEAIGEADRALHARIDVFALGLEGLELGGTVGQRDLPFEISERHLGQAEVVDLATADDDVAAPQEDLALGAGELGSFGHEAELVDLPLDLQADRGQQALAEIDVAQVGLDPRAFVRGRGAAGELAAPDAGVEGDGLLAGEQAEEGGAERESGQVHGHRRLLRLGIGLAED